MDLEPAISIDKFMSKKFKIVELEGEFEKLIGKPQLTGLWVIYGKGGSGKTTLALRLMKVFAQFKIKSAYNSIEMRTSLSLQQAIGRENLLSVKTYCTIWNSYTVENLRYVLNKKRSPKIIVIDSLQYLRMNSKSGNELTKFELEDLIKEFPDKLFIVISHAKNDYPKGALGDAAHYESHVAILVKDMIAYPDKTRYGGNTKYEIRKFN
jgi:archaellum biogenesis ATPase FlaH